MTKERAIKHLERAKEHLAYLNESYVKNERNKHPMMDINWDYTSGLTLRETRRKDILDDMADVKERIARLQRIAL